MRTRAVVLMLLCSTARLSAQYGPVQDSTLIGIRRIVLTMSTNLRGPRTFREDTALELRKAGIRIAETPGVDSVDAVMNILVRGPENSAHGATVRIDLEQPARLVRTGKTHRMVTWFFEQDVSAERELEPALKRGIDAFLTKWLDMNGR